MKCSPEVMEYTLDLSVAERSQLIAELELWGNRAPLNGGTALGDLYAVLVGARCIPYSASHGRVRSAGTAL